MEPSAFLSIAWWVGGGGACPYITWWRGWVSGLSRKFGVVCFGFLEEFPKWKDQDHNQAFKALVARHVKSMLGMLPNIDNMSRFQAVLVERLASIF
eukprot:6391248-Amphidinium_carterae.1